MSKWKPQPHAKVNHELTWRHPRVGHVKTMRTRMYNKLNLDDLLLHLHERTTTPTTMNKDKRKSKTMKKMFHPDPIKSPHEFEQEPQEIIPSNKSLMILKRENYSL